MDRLNKEVLFDLLDERPGPCLSLYQNTHRHHPENAQDPIRFANLVKQLKDSLREYPADERARLLEPFERLRGDADFWNHTLDGLAVLSAAGESHVFRLPRPVVDFAVVAQSWHVKPLFRVLRSSDRFHVLCLTREWVRLYVGNRDALDEVDLPEGFPRTVGEALGGELSEPYQKVASYGMGPSGRPGSDMRHSHGGKKDEIDKDVERFFRVLDKALLERVSRATELPMVLVTLPEYQGVFRGLSHNPFLLAEGVSVDPGALDLDKMRQQAWQAVEPSVRRRVDDVVERYRVAHGSGLASEELDEVLRAAAEGRVATLIVDADAHIPGRIEPDTMRVQREDSFNDPSVGDVLDDLVVLVLRQGGEALVVAPSAMPVSSGLAAIYRF